MRNFCTLGMLAVLTAATVVEAKGPPPELVATIALTTGNGLKPVRDLADVVKPGSGQMLNDGIVKMVLANVAKVPALDGFDTSGFAYVLVDSDGEVALLGHVSDDKALAKAVGGAARIKDHWAVIGAPGVLAKLGAYALDTLAKQASPNQLGATLYPQHVLAKFRDKIAAIRQQLAVTSTASGQMGDFVVAEFDGLLGMAGDTDMIDVGLATTQTAATLDVAFVPTAGSRLAKFVALQKPSTFALLDKLPPTQAMMLLAGHLETGPYHDGLFDMVLKIYAAAAGKELGEVINSVMKAATGELAMTMDLRPGVGIAMTQVFSLSDPRGAEAAVTKLVDLFKTPKSFKLMGYTTTFTATPNVPPHDGVQVRGYDLAYDFSQMPAAQQTQMKAMFPAAVHARVATFDGTGMFVMAPQADAEANLVIDTARGKGSRFVPSKPIGELLTAARARQDSLALVVDIASMMAAFGKTMVAPGTSAPGVIALGFADKQAHLRFATTLSAIKTLAHP